MPTTYEPIAWEGPLPRHLAVIMDGNGRWAAQRGMPRVAGHREGAKAVRRTVRLCRRLGIEALTLYAFSSQNWHRPADEVAALMELLREYVLDERDEILGNGIRFECIGDLARLPAYVRDPMDDLVAVSADNDEMILSLAVSFGGREDLTQAVRSLARQVAEGTLRPEAIDEQAISDALWTRVVPTNVDLLIRTSGELRVSNFLLWNIAYAELWFTEALWPDFGDTHLMAALEAFGERERRFGGV